MTVMMSARADDSTPIEPSKGYPDNASSPETIRRNVSTSNPMLLLEDARGKVAAAMRRQERKIHPTSPC